MTALVSRLTPIRVAQPLVVHEQQASGGVGWGIKGPDGEPCRLVTCLLGYERVHSAISAPHGGRMGWVG